MTNRIRTLRSERGWSQADLAQRLGVSRQTAHAIESGKSDPALSLALRVAWLFGHPVEDIFMSSSEERMQTLQATYVYRDRKASAFDEVAVLTEMGREGWELIGFGIGVLQFRRPENAALRRVWEYRRVDGLLGRAEKTALEREWTFVGSWMAVFAYFKRERLGT